MQRALLSSLLFFGLAFRSYCQDAPRATRATPEEMEKVLKEARDEALSDAKRGKFVLRSFPGGFTLPLLGELQEVVQRRGITWDLGPNCAQDLMDFINRDPFGAEVALAKFDTYNKEMLKEIKLHFGDDIFVRLNKEAEALYEAKNKPPKTTKPSTPKARSAKSKK